MKSSHKISNDRKRQRLATSLTSPCYKAWSRPLYHEHAFAQSIPNCHCYVVMAGCACTVGEMNAKLTVVFLNEIVSGVGGGGGESVMVWAAIAHGYHSQLVVIDGNLNVQRYRDYILAHYVILLFHNNANISIFQLDNATFHTARDTVHFLRTNNIDFIDDSSANSPDLNPIEYVWDSLDRRLRRRPNPPANVNELRQALIQEWNNIPQAEINTLVNSMCRRCTTVVNFRDGHTRH